MRSNEEYRQHWSIVVPYAHREPSMKTSWLGLTVRSQATKDDRHAWSRGVSRSLAQKVFFFA